MLNENVKLIYKKLLNNVITFKPILFYKKNILINILLHSYNNSNNNNT